MACGCTSYSSETGESLIAMVAGVFRAKSSLWQLDFGTDGPDPTGICIDDTTSYRDSRGQTEFAGGLLTQSTTLFSCASIFAILVCQSMKAVMHGTR